MRVPHLLENKNSHPQDHLANKCFGGAPVFYSLLVFSVLKRNPDLTRNYTAKLIKFTQSEGFINFTFNSYSITNNFFPRRNKSFVLVSLIIFFIPRR